MTDADMYAFLSYYDTKNLATSITSPYITSIGLQDNVCPPHTNIAPYNNAATTADDKNIIFNPELQHATNADWYETYMTFFKKYMKNTTGIKEVESQKEDGRKHSFDLQGRQVEQPARGLYIKNGRKYVVR
jgi:cephalosporin-C deacetylase